MDAVPRCDSWAKAEVDPRSSNQILQSWGSWLDSFFSVGQSNAVVWSGRCRGYYTARFLNPVLTKDNLKISAIVQPSKAARLSQRWGAKNHSLAKPGQCQKPTRSKTSVPDYGEKTEMITWGYATNLGCGCADITMPASVNRFEHNHCKVAIVAHGFAPYT